MIISNTALIIGLSCMAAASFVGILFFAQRELKRKNAYGIPQFRSYFELVTHRILKLATTGLFILSIVGMGIIYLTGLNLIVESGFAAKSLGVLVLLITLISAGCIYVITKRKRRTGPGEARTREAFAHMPSEHRLKE